MRRRERRGEGRGSGGMGGLVEVRDDVDVEGVKEIDRSMDR